MIGLNTVAMRICFASTRLHAPNVAALEVFGVVSALVEKLLAIVFAGSLKLATLHQLFTAGLVHLTESDSAPGSPHRHPTIHSATQKTEDEASDRSSDLSEQRETPSHSPEVMGTVASELILLLQIVSVATANRDNSIAALLALVLQHSTLCFSACSSTSHGPEGRCQNCEMEVACLQCLNDG